MTVEETDALILELARQLGRAPTRGEFVAAVGHHPAAARPWGTALVRAGVAGPRSRAECVAAIRALAVELGGTPLRAEFVERHGNPRGARPYVDLCREAGLAPWREERDSACIDCGVSVRPSVRRCGDCAAAAQRRRHDADRARTGQLLRAWVEAHGGERPTVSTWDGEISVDRIRWLYGGSWVAALRAAGIDVPPAQDRRRPRPGLPTASIS
ncbi:hypothetical protein GKE82_24175 [Conexibacter sp. W3-3-2]|uniref:hypothetical protein n=1 Tax=Conexibacter sp. W3-3-2 TaxID=2675227 RepID=UPI0012B793D6|nr:hypothetical protein [Conexibacter sp. W3-3-2]MTD47306.1 hypothetical protein [Conexibacter sp. W3-3-2]